MQGRNQAFGGVFIKAGVLPEAIAKGSRMLKEIP